MCYNAFTSEGFFFFAKRSRLNGIQTYCGVLFADRQYLVCEHNGRDLETEGGVYFYSVAFFFAAIRVKAKKYFRKAGGAVMRVKITLACSECKQRNYNTMKNKKNDPDRLEMNKYCRFCKKHTLHKETK